MNPLPHCYSKPWIVPVNQKTRKLFKPIVFPFNKDWESLAPVKWPEWFFESLFEDEVFYFSFENYFYEPQVTGNQTSSKLHPY